MLPDSIPTSSVSDLEFFSQSDFQDNGWIGAGDIIYEWTDKFPFATTFWSKNMPNQNYIGEFQHNNHA